MAYCGPNGLSLDEFLKWPQYAQDAALAWSAREAQRCRSCGIHPDDGVVHAHMRQCATCDDRELVAQQAQKETQSGNRGIYVEMAHGEFHKCKRCLDRIRRQRED